MFKANRLKYWHNFFGDLYKQKIKNYEKKKRANEKNRKLTLWVLSLVVFSILTVSLIVAFSKTSYAAGNIGSWNSATSLPWSVESPAAVAFNGYIYVLGGWGGPGIPYAHNEVIFAKVNSDGTLQPWASTTPFATGRYLHAATIDPNNRMIYVIGGWDTNGIKLNDLQYAPILSNGNIGAWNTTTSFPHNIYGHSAMAYNGYLYVMGGGPEPYTSVFFAKINSDGSLGAWQTNFYTFTSDPRRYLGTVAYNGNFYMTGGQSLWYNTALSDVQYAPAKPAPIFTGPLEQWKTTTPLPITRYFHTSVAANNYLYVLGGENCNYNDFSGSLLSDVLYARINSDGTVGTWNSTTSLPYGLTSHASVVLNGYIYIIGGSTGDCSTGFTKDTVLFYMLKSTHKIPHHL